MFIKPLHVHINDTPLLQKDFWKYKCNISMGLICLILFTSTAEKALP